MFNLMLDAGNTRIKAGLFEGITLIETRVFEYEGFISLLGHWVQDRKIQHIFVSDVSGKLEQATMESDYSAPLSWLRAETPMPFDNKYLSKETLGSDRKALVAGAMHFYPKEACLIIDAGTCVTYDFLQASQEYLGGNITPGLQMRLHAMNTFTGKLPLLQAQQPLTVMGQDTESCLQSGAYFGLIGEMEYLIAFYKSENPQLKILLTGGDADTLAKSIKTSIFAQEHLLLYGLNKIFLANAE